MLLQGVIGTIVVNNEGVPIKSTLDNPTTVQYSGLLNNLVDQVALLKIVEILVYFFLSKKWNKKLELTQGSTAILNRSPLL